MNFYQGQWRRNPTPFLGGMLYHYAGQSESPFPEHSSQNLRICIMGNTNSFMTQKNH